MSESPEDLQQYPNRHLEDLKLLRVANTAVRTSECVGGHKRGRRPA